jgi:hypothetical protein
VVLLPPHRDILLGDGHFEQIARKARAGLWPMWLGEK